MLKGSKTTLFISSTCYDLSQVRADLKDFADSIGMEPILSEFDSFPVNPNQTTLSNCLDAVKNRTDIFILIVGGRYGSLSDTGKSITNLEYFEAKAKGIPKYIFVKENILTLLSIWKANPDSDYSSVVDNPSLFQFVTELRDSGDAWVFPFSYAQDIITVLRKQLSYLFADCLDLRARLQGSNELLANLKPKAFRIAIEKPKGWELLLFAQVLSDAIESHGSKRLDTELGISYGEPVVLNDVLEVMEWMSSRFSWISSTIKQLTKAINTGFIKAIGEPGEIGDLGRILHLANRISDGYEQLLNWNLQFLRVHCDDEFDTLLNLVSKFSSNAIEEIEKFSGNLYSTMEGYIKESEAYETLTVVEITLTLTAPDTEPFSNELSRLASIYGIEIND